MAMANARRVAFDFRSVFEFLTRQYPRSFFFHVGRIFSYYCVPELYIALVPNTKILSISANSKSTMLASRITTVAALLLACSCSVLAATAPYHDYGPRHARGRVGDVSVASGDHQRSAEEMLLPPIDRSTVVEFALHNCLLLPLKVVREVVGAYLPQVSRQYVLSFCSTRETLRLSPYMTYHCDYQISKSRPLGGRGCTTVQATLKLVPPPTITELGDQQRNPYVPLRKYVFRPIDVKDPKSCFCRPVTVSPPPLPESRGEERTTAATTARTYNATPPPPHSSMPRSVFKTHDEVLSLANEASGDANASPMRSEDDSQSLFFQQRRTSLYHDSAAEPDVDDPSRAYRPTRRFVFQPIDH